MALRDEHFGLCPLGSGAVRLGSVRVFLRFLSGFSLASFYFSFACNGGGIEAA